MLGQLSPSLLTPNLSPWDLHLTDEECVLRLYDLLIIVPKKWHLSSAHSVSGSVQLFHLWGRGNKWRITCLYLSLKRSFLAVVVGISEKRWEWRAPDRKDEGGSENGGEMAVGDSLYGKTIGLSGWFAKKEIGVWEGESPGGYRILAWVTADGGLITHKRPHQRRTTGELWVQNKYA